METIETQATMNKIMAVMIEPWVSPLDIASAIAEEMEKTF
jgi:hypothetical protein